MEGICQAKKAKRRRSSNVCNDSNYIVPPARKFNDNPLPVGVYIFPRFRLHSKLDIIKQRRIDAKRIVLQTMVDVIREKGLRNPQLDRHVAKIEKENLEMDIAQLRTMVQTKDQAIQTYGPADIKIEEGSNDATADLGTMPLTVTPELQNLLNQNKDLHLNIEVVIKAEPQL